MWTDIVGEYVAGVKKLLVAGRLFYRVWSSSDLRGGGAQGEWCSRIGLRNQ